MISNILFRNLKDNNNNNNLSLLSLLPEFEGENIIHY